MGHTKRLLLITQPEAAASNALLHALKLTKNLRGSLRIVSFVHSETVDMVGMMNHDGRDKARENMMDLHRLWVQSRRSVQACNQLLTSGGICPSRATRSG
jgi:hypothetical protein